MNTQELAEKYKVRIRKDTCGDEIIPGKAHKSLNAKRPEDHPHVYVTDRGRVAAFMVCRTHAIWLSFQRRLEEANSKPLEYIVRAHAEGLFFLDAENEALMRLFFKLARIRIKRQLTEEQRQKLQERMSRRK